ncbi:MAG: extracellular solute-binding protein [Pseudomonadota bacterium]
MHGSPQLSADFSHFDYVNATAPKAGRLVLGELGTFDSLNRFVLKGSAPWILPSLTVESLMARNYAEPFALYGLLAESIETPPDRSWVAFTLRPGARFADGAPVTVEDVIWSLETLGTEGHPRYRAAWQGVSSIAATGPRTVRIDFNEPNRELPLLMGLRPILQKAQFDGQPLDGTIQAPIGSGPYQVTEYEAGRFVHLKRNPDWWAADLPAARGVANFDEIRLEYYRNAEALWEGVQTGAVSVFYDADPVRWAEGYDIPAVQQGQLERGQVPHSRPTGMDGFAFNTRRAPFDDIRVRQALALALDWEWVNERLFRGQYTRIQSFYDNSALAAQGAAEDRELEILAPFADQLPDGVLDGPWRPPISNGTGRDRRNLRRAGALLDDAGWSAADGQRRAEDGTPLSFEILVANADHQTLASLWASSLERLGVAVEVRQVDATQYRARLRTFDFDVIFYQRRMSLSPGTEQLSYFGSEARLTEGSRNYMGVADPAVDAAIAAMLAAEGQGDFQAAVRALDRVLTGGVYVVPLGYLPTDRLTWQRGIRKPQQTSLYGWWGWAGGIGTWWFEQP